MSLEVDLRGPNHVLVSRRTASARRRIDKIFARFDEVHVHGMGAAIASTISLAATIVEESCGSIVASASTSTVLLIDRYPPETLDADESCQLRHNSALHITLSKTTSKSGEGSSGSGSGCGSGVTSVAVSGGAASAGVAGGCAKRAACTSPSRPGKSRNGAAY